VYFSELAWTGQNYNVMSTNYKTSFELIMYSLRPFLTVVLASQEVSILNFDQIYTKNINIHGTN
jgi:hypothetical protein